MAIAWRRYSVPSRRTATEVTQELGRSGKSALITCASKGIGRSVAEVLAEEGCDVILAARDAARLEATAAEIRAKANVRVMAMAADLSKTEDQDRLARDCAEVDILINGAGANPPGEIDEVSDDVWRSVKNLKVFGYINMTRHFYRHMKAGRAGVIVIGNSGERMQSSYILGWTGDVCLIGLTRALGARAPDFVGRGGRQSRIDCSRPGNLNVEGI
jgi:NAD(P)-dependent dehydrogenase (short-subunit alcohol dehydrogenase family)